MNTTTSTVPSEAGGSRPGRPGSARRCRCRAHAPSPAAPPRSRRRSAALRRPPGPAPAPRRRSRCRRRPCPPASRGARALRCRSAAGLARADPSPRVLRPLSVVLEAGRAAESGSLGALVRAGGHVRRAVRAPGARASLSAVAGSQCVAGAIVAGSTAPARRRLWLRTIPITTSVSAIGTVAGRSSPGRQHRVIGHGEYGQQPRSPELGAFAGQGGTQQRRQKQVGITDRRAADAGTGEARSVEVGLGGGQAAVSW